MVCLENVFQTSFLCLLKGETTRIVILKINTEGHLRPLESITTQIKMSVVAKHKSDSLS